MKKWSGILVILILLCMVCACGSKEKSQNGQQTDRKNQQSSQDVSNNGETETENAAGSGERDSKETSDVVTTWNSEHFERLGIPDIDSVGLGALGEPILYEYNADAELLTVAWDGSEDFGAITGFGETLFQKTEDANGGNYGIVFDENACKWVLDQKRETFADACRYWEAKEYYAEWYYEKDGQIVMFTFFGMHNEEEDYVRLSACIYQD